MGITLAKREGYSRAEYLSDMAVHLAGILAVTAAVPVVIVLAALLDGNVWQVTAASVYGASLFAMIGCSALYNIFPHPDWEWLLQRLDHSAIYLKIAGTYTAFVLIAGHGFALAAGLWAAAAAGISLKLISPARWRLVGLALYIGMGWAATLVGWDLFRNLPGPVVTLVATGGLLYTVGVVFYLWDRLPFHNTIWHCFVLAASLTIYSGLVVAVVL
jgi:hemolysin III